MKIDGILVVNLDKRPERWELFRKYEKNWELAFGQIPFRFAAVCGVELDGYNELPWFRDRINEARRRSWGGKAGAILSHRNAIKYASDKGWENVLIVEDDAFITEEIAVRWKQQLSFMTDELPEGWAVIYLYTAKPFTPCRVVAEEEGYRVIETAGAFGCVAYIVNRLNYKPLLDALPDEKTIWRWVARYKAIDLWFSQNLSRYGRVYALAPSPIEHQIGPSDITVTPESEWTFDGTMSGITLVTSELVFFLKMVARRISWTVLNVISLLRFTIKRIRGL